ncbi:MAG: hypothetical protein O3C63_01425 [Cyanobacteria bacterium]|nr:hypothetical protein [Cyanobacteriota bacterium]
MTDNVSRLRGVEGYNRSQGVNSISTRLNRITGAGSRSGGVSRGRIYDIAKSSGVALGANSRLVSTESIASSGREIRTANARRANVNRGRLTYKNAFDTNKDGTVSDRESMNYLIKLRKNNSERGLAELMQFNQTTQRINENLNNIDSDNNGVISDREAMTRMMADRAGSSSENDSDIVAMILSNNSRKDELEVLVARVDTEADGQISREEVLAVLTEMRNNNLDPALIESLTQVLELNPDLDAIVTEFENSIGSNYVAEQHAEAQVLLTRRGQELQLLNGTPDLMPSPLGLLEELAEIYGDEYLSQDESSPDFYKFGGLTGLIEDALIAQGRTIEDLINGQVSQADMDLIFGQVTQYSPDQSAEIEASFAEQHQSVVNYLNQARADLSNPLVDVAINMPSVFEDIAGLYGDLGFFDEGFTGFTGALQNGLSAFNSMDADSVVSVDFLTQMSDMLTALPGVTEPAEPLTVEERLAQFADINGDGDVDMSDALRLASMIHSPPANRADAPVRPAGFTTGHYIAYTPEGDNFNLGFYDFDGDGQTGVEDLRIMMKFIDGARGDDLYLETGDTVQSYIENILIPDSPISITPFGFIYQGVLGRVVDDGDVPVITQDDITHLTNIVQGNPELNYPDGAVPIHGDHLEIAVNKGLLDVNNDGITDMDDVAILQRYVDGARGEGLLASKAITTIINESLEYLDSRQDFYTSQIDGLNNLLARWQGVNDDTGFARAQIAQINSHINAMQNLSGFVARRSEFWNTESGKSYPAGTEESRSHVYEAANDLERRYEAAVKGESNENVIALGVELFKTEVMLHNLKKGISLEGLNSTDVDDIYNDGGLTNQGKAIQSYEFSKFKVNFFNSNIEGLENTLEQWQSVNDDTGFAATQIAAINEQLDKVNQVRDYWDTRDEFWHDQAFLTYDPNQTEVVKNLYLGIADLERRADNSILNGSDEEIDAIQQGIIQLTGVLDAMHGFSFEALTSDEDNQLRVLLHNRIIESILGGTDVGNIFGDQDLDDVLGQIAQIYGDNRTIDSKYGYVPDPVTGAATTEVMQLNTATGQPESVNSDPSLIAVQDPALGAYQFFNADGEVDVDEYTRYQQDYAKAYGGALLDPTDPASAITPPAGRADSEGINAAELLPTYTGLTRAIHNEVLDFQQVDSSGTPLPLEIDALYQILYSLENN